MSEKATAGHLAADIRRAVARLDRAVILWGGRALGDDGWDACGFAALIQHRCDGAVWAKERAFRWERRLGVRCCGITQAMRVANASITRAAPFLAESLGPMGALPVVA